MIVLGGSTDVTTYFALRLAATGAEATGLTITNFDLQYVRTGVAPVAKVDATALAATDSAHADNKAFEIDATDQPGLYRVDWPDAAFAAGVREVILTVKCATAFTEHLRVTIDPLVVANSITAGAITATAIADNAIDAGAIAADAITATKIATGALTAAKFAAGAIDAAALAADAGTEIGTAVWATTTRILTAATNLTALASQASVDTIDGIVDSILVDTGTTLDDLIQALPTNAELATALGTADDATLAAIAALTIPSAAVIADAVWDEDATGHQAGGTFGQAIGDPVADTNTIYGAVVTGAAGATVAADIIAVKTETAAILDDTDDIGVAGAGLTALATQASVTAVDDLLDTELPALTTAVDALPTNAELATALGTADDAVLAAIAALNNLSAAQVNTEVDTAIADARLDELLAADSDIDGAAPPTVGSVFHELLTKTAGSFTYDQTTDSIEAIRDRGDAAWTTATGFSTHSAADVWTVAVRVLTAATNLGALASQTSVDDLPTNAELATSQAAADDATLAAIAALNNLSAAAVNAEVVDALNVDTYAEPGQGAPAATATLVAKVGYLYKAFRNKKTQTATTYSLFNDDAATVDQKSTVSDDAVTVTRGEIASGP